MTGCGGVSAASRWFVLSASLVFGCAADETSEQGAPKVDAGNTGGTTSSGGRGGAGAAGRQGGGGNVAGGGRSGATATGGAGATLTGGRDAGIGGGGGTATGGAGQAGTGGTSAGGAMGTDSGASDAATDASADTGSPIADARAPDAGRIPDGSGTDSGSIRDGGQSCDSGSCSAVAPSCRGLAADCGSAGNESCCESLLVTGGTFFRSYDGVTHTDKSFPATVSDFRLDKYEVTVGRFRRFVAAWVGGWRPANGAGKHAHLNGGSGLSNSGGSGFESGWQTSWSSLLPQTASMWNTSLVCRPAYAIWSPNAGSSEHKPVNCTFWYEAMAFCIWDGGFLPSEAEWNYAAAGGDEARTYAWGPTAPGAGPSVSVHGCYYFGTGPGSCSGSSNIAPVGSAPAGVGKYGQADLNGNVWEWTLDWRAAQYVTPCQDCAYVPFSAASRMTRGGSFGSSGNALLSANRNGFNPTQRDEGNGFRCARSP
jgi:formylglycine-generating enzyme